MKINVLLVEDDRAYALLLERLIDLTKYTVQVAFDEEEALQKFKVKDYPIVLTDINMQKIDGYELIKEIRKINFKTLRNCN